MHNIWAPVLTYIIAAINGHILITFFCSLFKVEKKTQHTALCLIQSVDTENSFHECHINNTLQKSTQSSTMRYFYSINVKHPPHVWYIMHYCTVLKQIN